MSSTTAPVLQARFLEDRPGPLRPEITSAAAEPELDIHAGQSRAQLHRSGPELARGLMAAFVPAYTWLLARGACTEAQALFRCGIAAAGALCSGPAGPTSCRCGALRRLVLLSIALRKQHPGMPDPLGIGR